MGIDSTGSPSPTPVRVEEDPASLAIRTRVAVAEEKQATNVAEMVKTLDALIVKLTAAMAPVVPPAVTDAQLWNGYFHGVLCSMVRHGPSYGSHVPAAEKLADEALAAYRKRYPNAS